jgi:Tfp pilus assembly PilM family ATPase
MNRKKFFNLFPPPEFLDISYAGLSISDTNVRCLKFGREGKKLSVSKYIERSVPPGAIVSGFINNVQEVVSIIEDMKKDLDLDFVKVSLPEEKAYLFTTKIPIMESEEIRDAVEFKMEENVPVPPAELLFDYAMPDSASHDHINVVVSALPITVIDKYVETINSVNLSLLSLEIESQAIARAVLPKYDMRTHLIVNFGKEKVGLYVVSNNVVHFTSTINTKGAPKDDLIFISQEIKKLYTYWHTLKENVEVESKKIIGIIICGEDISDQIIPYLSTHIKTKVTLANVWINAFDINKEVPKMSFVDSLKFATAVGLALPEDILI